MGIRGMTFREEDAPRHMVVAKHARQRPLLHRPRPRVPAARRIRDPRGRPHCQGRSHHQLINIEPRETITAVISTAAFEDNQYLVMATAQGEIKKVAIERVRVGALEWADRHGPRAG